MASIKIIQRKKMNQSGLFPIIMQVIKDRRRKIISLGMECSTNDWDKTTSSFKKSHANYIQRNRVLLKLQEKALKLIDDFNINDEDFTLEMFESKFRGKELSKISVAEFWLDLISDLEISGRIGNARAHKDTYRSIFKFHKDKKLTFKQLDFMFLNKYETFLRSTGNNDGGIGVKMRQIRAMFNDAIKKGIAKQEHYPFKVYKVAKLKGKGSKEALTIGEIKRFKSLNIMEFPHLTNAYHYFLFSYYARGMNFQDMMTLKWSDLVGSRIQYNRSKTKKRFTIAINQPMQEVLDYYKKLNRNSAYIFPILLHDDLSAKQIANRKHKVLSRYNKKLKEIAKIQKIDKNITSYVARHSFATNLKFLDVSTDKISQLMGHSNINVTQAYLRDFGDEGLDQEVRKLLQEPKLKYA